jgi:hypothetical protein
VSDSVTQVAISFTPLRPVISADRLQGYERLGGGMLDALARYSWNSHLGASLYPTLLHLEVAFRNRLHDAIASRYPIGPWRDIDCWLGRVPSVLAPSEVAQVQVATDRLRRSGKTIAPGRVIAELTFGFWTNLLDVRYERRQVFWPPLLEGAFPHLPAVRRTRRIVARRFNMLRRLRNRVFHYEPIWHWRDLRQQHELLLEAIAWLSPELLRLASATDRFPVTYANGWRAYRATGWKTE